jgi:hypothetical protein
MLHEICKYKIEMLPRVFSKKKLQTQREKGLQETIPAA